MIQFKISKIFLIVMAGIYWTEVNAIELTIYSTANPGTLSANNLNLNNTLPGYAYVIDQRDLALESGQNEIRYTNLPMYLDPTTVQFRSLTDTNTEILGQEYHFDLFNNQALLTSYLGQEITVDQDYGSNFSSVTGTLLSIQNGLILQDKNNQIISVNKYSAIRFPTTGNKGFNQPTLIWTIVSKKQGLHKTETRYQTREITWWADYNAIFEENLDQNSGTLELNSWVTVANKTGRDFEKADIKLISGDVNIVKAAQTLPKPNLMMAAKMGSGESFTENPLFEYYVYNLNSKISLPNNATKQIKFFPKISNIPVEKLYLYESNPGMLYTGYNNTDQYANTNTMAKVDVYLKWKNSNKFGLGIPLPAGRVRVSTINTSSKIPEFIGEDIIDNTAQDEEVQIKMGSAVDVSVEKKQTDFSLDANRHIMEESFEIEFKNYKDQDIKVFVQENFYRTANWTVIKNSSSFQKINSNTVKFPLTVKAKNTTKVTYTVRYTW